MTLFLERGTEPRNLRIKTFGYENGDTIHLGEYVIYMEDFLIAAHYVLTNTDLNKNNPRIQFVECVRSMKEVLGWSGTAGKRLSTDIEPVSDKE